MKADFTAEAIHADPVLARKLRRFGVSNEMPWVAEVTGKDPKFGYVRRFLRARADFRDANSAGSRGVWHHWILEDGRIYEARYRESWGGWTRMFLQVTPEGDIETIGAEEVELWLSADSGSTS